MRGTLLQACITAPAAGALLLGQAGHTARCTLKPACYTCGSVTLLAVCANLPIHQ
jgi:hypothetical protein